MSAGLNLHIFVVLRTDLAELERGAHLAVKLILLLQGQKRKAHRLLTLKIVVVNTYW